MRCGLWRPRRAGGRVEREDVDEMECAAERWWSIPWALGVLGPRANGICGMCVLVCPHGKRLKRGHRDGISLGPVSSSAQNGS